MTERIKIPGLAHDLELAVICKDEHGVIYQSNLWDILRDVVDETKTSIDLLIGPKSS